MCVVCEQILSLYVDVVCPVGEVVVVPGAQWAVCYDITDGCTQIALYAERKR